MQSEKRGIVIFDSRFGNTEKIAKALDRGLASVGIDSRCVNAKQVSVESLEDYELVAVGAPTEWLSASMNMKKFLENLRNVDLRGKWGFAFDTKLGRALSGSAAGRIENDLRKSELRMISPRESAIVYGTSNSMNGMTLKDGEEKRFEEIGAKIGADVKRYADGRIVSSTTERRPYQVEPPFAPILGSILGVVAWLLFILLYALYWSKSYDLFQNAVVTIVSLLVMMLGIGTMWLIWYRLTGEPRASWNHENRATKNNEHLYVGQRAGEIVAAAVFPLIFGFFAYQQYANTGFFTNGFQSWEMLALYGSISLSMIPPLARAFVGRRNPVRPYEAAVNIFFGLATLYLLGVFPFNFVYFANGFPDVARFAFVWITNDIARVVMVLMIAGSFVSAGVNILRYLTFNLDVFERKEQVIVK